jgi:uncharacterized protein YqfB (UPF0267 family)
MGLYNFKKRFVAYILAGEKTHTIRSRRANADKPGNTLHLYTGLRQKGARCLMRVACVKVEEITVAVDGTVTIEGVQLSDGERDDFARRDGFPGGWPEMYAYWLAIHQLPFEGHVIHWRNP